jgi:hypothetical protein
MMSDDRVNDQQDSSNNPQYRDELDVLKAVAALEEKYGKKLLTEEQRKRVFRKSAGKDNGSLPVNNLFFSGLIDDFGPYEGIKGTSAWGQMAISEKQFVEDVVFRMRYGCFPNLFLYKLGDGMDQL